MNPAINPHDPNRVATAAVMSDTVPAYGVAGAPHAYVAPHRRISWGAVFAGALLALIKQARAKLKETKDAAALKAREAGDDAASGLSKAAILTP